MLERLDKHTRTHLVRLAAAFAFIASARFKKAELLTRYDLVEITSARQRQAFNRPVVVGHTVLNLSKLTLVRGAHFFCTIFPDLPYLPAKDNPRNRFNSVELSPLGSFADV